MALKVVILILALSVATGMVIPAKDGGERVSSELVSDPCQLILEAEVENYVEELKIQGMSAKNQTAEPTLLDNYTLDVDISIQKIEWKYSDINLFGAKYFFFEEFVLGDNLKFSYKVNWPYVRDSRNYKVDGSALEANGEWIPIFGNGTFDNIYVNLTLEGTGKLHISNDYIQIEHLSVYISSKKCNVKTTGYMGNEEDNDEANRAINKNCPGVMVVMRQLLNTTLSPVVKTFYNKSLKGEKTRKIVEDYNECLKTSKETEVAIN